MLHYNNANYQDFYYTALQKIGQTEWGEKCFSGSLKGNFCSKITKIGKFLC